MSDLFLEGVQLTILGLGTVFVFLVILIFGTTLMSAVIGRIPVAPEPVGNPRVKNTRASGSPEEVAIAAAVAQATHDASGRS